MAIAIRTTYIGNLSFLSGLKLNEVNPMGTNWSLEAISESYFREEKKANLSEKSILAITWWVILQEKELS